MLDFDLSNAEPYVLTFSEKFEKFSEEIKNIPPEQKLQKIKSAILYRYLTNTGEGAWHAGKKQLPEELANEADKQRSWLARPELSKDDEYESWFTQSGRDQYLKTLKPIHDKYLKLKEITGNPSYPVAYSDPHQILFKKPKIRSLTEQDIPHLIDIDKEAFPDDPYDEETFKKHLLQGSGFAIDHEGKPVAYSLHRPVESRPGFNYIQSLATHKDHRKKGYASLLLDKIKSLGKGVTLDVDVKNKGARSLYKKHGFKFEDVLEEPNTGRVAHHLALKMAFDVDADEEARQKLPYRDRAEIYALKDGKVFGSIYPDSKAFGVYGGGVDPGENPEQAAVREFQEESGWTVKNPKLLPFNPLLNEWKPPYVTDKQRERSKQYRGSRTHYLVGELGEQVPNAKIDELGRIDPRLYSLDEATKLATPEGHGISLTIANHRRAEILKHLKKQHDKSTLDRLLEAKAHSDEGNYAKKHSILQQLIKESPGDWTTSDFTNPYFGYTHNPTNFKIHGPRNLFTLLKSANEIEEDLVKLAADDAPGIPSRQNYGDMSKLQPGSMLDLIIQEHLAERAGKHQDLRLGSKDLGLYSWASRHGLPEPGQKRLGIQQPIHDYDYGSFEGTIPEGYGKGEVKKHSQRQIMLTKVTPGEIHFTTTDKKHNERFAMIQTKDRNWLMLNTTPTQALPYQKLHYTRIPGDQVEQTLQSLQPGSSVQAKIDGASSLIKLLKDGVELTSYRTAKDTGHPIVHTEKFFQGLRPHVSVPKHLQGSVLRGELYGARQQDGNEEVIHPSELGGILNATIANSLQAQKAKNIKLKNMLFDIQQYGNKPVNMQTTPYAERRKMLEDIFDQVPLPGFHLADQVTTPEESQKMWHNIIGNKHPLTHEGIVIHPPTGKPMKAKPREDYDVHLTDVFPGEGKYLNTGAGGFSYALKPGGPTVGKVGTGLSDEMRKELYTNPQDYIGRVARIQAQEQLPSGAYRAPGFIAFHEDYPTKSGSDNLVLVKRAKDDNSQFTICIDLDGTLAEKEEPYSNKTIGEPRERTVFWTKLFHEAGARIIIFTVRGDTKLVKSWLEEHDIPFDYINENPDQPKDGSNKLIADAYIDDKGYNAENPDEFGPVIFDKLLSHDKKEKHIDEEPNFNVSIRKTTIIIAAPDMLEALCES